MLDHFGGRDRAETKRFLQSLAPCDAEQEAGRKEVAGAGRVHQLPDRLRRNVRPLPGANRKGPVLAAGDDQGFDLGCDCGDGSLEVSNAGERLDFRLVREQYVDPPTLEQLVEAVTV